MKEPPRRSSGTRGPGSYTTKACSVCRLKKIKCDGGRPSCETCLNGGRADECTYGKEVGRRPRSESHYQTLYSRISLLFKYAHHLESLLDQCQREHAGSLACGYRQHRPEYWEDPEFTDPLIPEIPELVEEEGDSENGEVANELCLPTQNLRLAEEGGLLLHGATAPFRYIPELMRPPIIPRIWSISDNVDESYTLFLEGSDETRYNPNLDWSRHLPHEVHMDRREHDKILDLVFKFYASWCMRIVPPLFLRDMHRALNVPKTQMQPRLSHYSPMLHNAILAIGTVFSDDPAIRDLKTRLYFLEKAKSYIDDECSRPHISVVNALSFIASFYSGQGDQTLGFVYFGMSARVGQALGLRVDCQSWVGKVITEEDQMDRNWTYWTTFCQDANWSFYVGREFCMPTASKNVPIPFADADFDKLHWYHAPSGVPSQPGYLSKTFSSTCQLSMINKNIMDVVNILDGSGNRQLTLDPKISDIDLALHRWHDGLPEELKNTIRMRSNPLPYVLQLHLTFHWSFILLHRPFYRRRSKFVANRNNAIDHAKICKRSADAIMELLTTWRNTFTLRYVPVTLMQTIFGAGTIYLLSALQSVEGVRVANKELSHAMTKTLDCIQYLKEAGESWPAAMKIASILRDWQQQTKPKIRERTALSPFASGTLPPKRPMIPAQDRNQDSTNEGGEAAKKKQKTPASGESSRKRQKSQSGADQQVSRTASGSSRTTSAPSISVSPSADPGNECSPVVPVVNQPLSLPTPPQISLSPSHQPQSSVLPETTSPLPLSSPYHGTTPVSPNPTQHLQPPPPSISSRTSSPQQLFVSSPQPHLWNGLPEDVLPLPDSQQQRGVSPPVRPSAPHPHAHEPMRESSSSQQQQPPSSASQQQSSTNDVDMLNYNKGVELDLDALDAKLISQSPSLATTQVPGTQQSTVVVPSNNQLSHPNYHLWAPGAIFSRQPLPVDTNNPVLPSGGDASDTINGRNVIGEACLETQKSLSPTSYQLAMPGGQSFWEMPFFPISYGSDFGDETASPEHHHFQSLQFRPMEQQHQQHQQQQQQQQQSMQEADHQMTTLNELGFEFVSRQGLSEDVGLNVVNGGGRNTASDGRDVDVDMNWEGREGWEDIGGECVTEEDFRNWFGVGS